MTPESIGACGPNHVEPSACDDPTFGPRPEPAIAAVRRALGALIVATFAALGLNGRAEPVTNLYEIVSGEYVVCCTLVGEVRESLPNESQSHIQLVTDTAQQRVQLTLLGFLNAEPVFQVLENGRVYADRIEFGMPLPWPGPELVWHHYIASNTAAGFRLNGITVHPVTGADIPNQFGHSNVVAHLLPSTPVEAIVRVSSVEICWHTVTNRFYQVQYRSDLTTNQWVNLQSPIIGDGNLRCVVEPVTAGQPRRFYRVVPVP